MAISTWEYPSPDGRWIAEGINADPKPGSAMGLQYRQLIVRAMAGSPAWTVIDSWAETGLGYTVLQPVAWSPNGKYFYYTNRPIPDGCTGIAPNSGDLVRVELETGNVTLLIPNQLSWSSLSHAGAQLAFLERGELTILDLDTGDRHSVMIDADSETNPGYAIWSQDDSRLAFTLANGSCLGPYPGTGVYTQSTSVVVFDLSTMELSTLVDKDKRRFVTEVWVGPDRIQLKDGQNRLWLLDVQTGQVSVSQP